MLRVGIERAMFTTEGDPQEWVARTLKWDRATGESIERQRSDGRWTRQRSPFNL
jgi:hypothetical protein